MKAPGEKVASNAIALGGLAGVLIMFVFQAGYMLVEAAQFGDGISRHWLGLPPFPAAVSGGVMGAVLALVISRWGRPPALVTVGFALAASCFAFVIMFVAEGPNGGEWGTAPAVIFGLIFGLLCAPLWVALALLLRRR